MILSDSKTRLRYDMFININNPDFNAAEAQHKFRDTFMTESEKRMQEINKQKVNALMYKIRSQINTKKAEEEKLSKEEFDLVRKRAQETIDKTREELLKQAEYMSEL
jgi:hypothetical protein